jgi:hypothetical protein
VSHLADRITDLVDGQLSPEATERANAHLVHCRACREAAEAERLTKARLSTLPAPTPGEDLLPRLLALGGPEGPITPRSGHVPGSPRPRPVPITRPPRGATAPRRGRTGPGGPGPSRRPRAPRRARLAVAVIGALGVIGVGVAATGSAMGGSADHGPTVVPPVDSFIVEHADTTTQLPFTDVEIHGVATQSQDAGAGR